MFGNLFKKKKKPVLTHSNVHAKPTPATVSGPAYVSPPRQTSDYTQDPTFIYTQSIYTPELSNSYYDSSPSSCEVSSVSDTSSSYSGGSSYSSSDSCSSSSYDSGSSGGDFGGGGSSSDY